jgi:hypothetical protein
MDNDGLLKLPYTALRFGLEALWRIKNTPHFQCLARLAYDNFSKAYG